LSHNESAFPSVEVLSTFEATAGWDAGGCNRRLCCKLVWAQALPKETSCKNTNNKAKHANLKVFSMGTERPSRKILIISISKSYGRSQSVQVPAQRSLNEEHKQAVTVSHHRRR
jgi:hypothetical protein